MRVCLCVFGYICVSECVCVLACIRRVMGGGGGWGLGVMETASRGTFHSVVHLSFPLTYKTLTDCLTKPVLVDTNPASCLFWTSTNHYQESPLV